ncbi:NAD(P)/FAD-dependent oxidoreductase [Novosphingobium aquimarinum]|uniref:NAD(P)/FAD-dependent oxidoreductase n=1 Tax=Novosphingobium aquimarinum TaxID=2682494 RepID=UPI001E4ED56B|nr:FAD-dependent monooxygenase [Novosphingobium aquimarinum]
MSGGTVIVGGGLAGAAAAIRLARGGAPVTLLEREEGPHDKICGEFLSTEACGYLDELGIDLDRLGAVKIDRVRLWHRHHHAETRLPFVARGLSRRILDARLLEEAARHGARVQEGVRVRGADADGVETSQGQIPADAVLLATGKHDLRGHPRARPATREGYVGFKMHFRLPARHVARADAIDLVLFDGGYAGLQRVAADIANLCLVISSDRLAAHGGEWDRLLAATLEEEGVARWLADAEPLFAKPLAIANLPYGYVCPADEPSGLWRLGDQAAMTASLTGDGMAIALRSARIAAETRLAAGSASDYHRAVREAAGTQVRRAMRLQRACETPPLRGAAMTVLRAFPSLLGLFAKTTRLPA